MLPHLPSRSADWFSLHNFACVQASAVTALVGLVCRRSRQPAADLVGGGEQDKCCSAPAHHHSDRPATNAHPIGTRGGKAVHKHSQSAAYFRRRCRADACVACDACFDCPCQKSGSTGSATAVLNAALVVLNLVDLPYSNVRPATSVMSDHADSWARPAARTKFKFRGMATSTKFSTG